MMKRLITKLKNGMQTGIDICPKKVHKWPKKYIKGYSTSL
jgi:hypothetical protein